MGGCKMTALAFTLLSQSAIAENIILVKRKTLLSFPKSATPTSFNLDIISNLKKCPPQRYVEVSGSYGGQNGTSI